MVQGCSSIDEKARTNVVKDVQELDKDEQYVVKGEHNVVKVSHSEQGCHEGCILGGLGYR